ncbi:MAG: class II glutamine amidotransferase [Endomicrobia bacterium]|nr:class II glutamine amidotransferase [Endomicrobiia bacterium]
MLGIKNFVFKKHMIIVENFFHLAKNGKIPPNNPRGHLDGWGIGWYEGTKARLYKSGNSVIKENAKFFDLVKQINETKILIIHFRKSAWKNTNIKKHSHPFKNDKLLFAHNGTIYNYDKISKYLNIDTKQRPLDSELYFLLLLYHYKKSKDLMNAYNETINFISKNCKYSSLTCLFSNGENLFAFRDYKKLSKYYTLFLANEQNSFFISSEPLGLNLGWYLLKPGHLLKV